MKRCALVLLAMMAVMPTARSDEREARFFRVIDWGIPLAGCNLHAGKVSKCHMAEGVKLDALMQSIYNKAKQQGVLKY